MATDDDYDFDPGDLYNEFPSAADHGYANPETFGQIVRLNDASLFTEDALNDPVIRAFVDAPFSVDWVEYGSSTPESEWALHKPHLARAGKVPGIVRRGVEPSDDEHPEHIATFFINHHRTMARWKQSIITMSDGTDSGQMAWKQEET